MSASTAGQPHAAPPLLVVISGPSGVGKDALIEALSERGWRYRRPVTMTTRTPREGEVDGVHYHFVSRERFEEAIRKGELLEHAEVHGRLYGLPRSSLRTALETGEDVHIQVDVQGAASLRPLLPGALFIFLAPASFEELEGRLRARASDDPVALEARLATARRELERRGEFDHVVVNAEGALDAAANELLALLERERARPDRAALEL